jgi:circadian clock protein KaiB
LLLSQEPYLAKPAIYDGLGYDLLLFIAGSSPRALRAEQNVRAFCNQYLLSRYQLAVIDLQQQPALAEAFGVIGLPMLLKRHPGLERRLVGDCADAERVRKVLGL